MEKTSWLAGMFNNPVADAILIIGIIGIVTVLAVFGKKGLLSVNIKGVSIGNGELERTIVRNQIDYCKSAVDAFVNSLPETEENKWRRRYIGELIFDVFVECISYNHINKSNFYIDNKTEKIWATIIKYSNEDEYRTQEFRNHISNKSREVFERLVDIRDYYSQK